MGSTRPGGAFTLATGAWVGNTVVLKGEALVLAPSRKLG